MAKHSGVQKCRGSEGWVEWRGLILTLVLPLTYFPKVAYGSLKAKTQGWNLKNERFIYLVFLLRPMPWRIHYKMNPKHCRTTAYFKWKHVVTVLESEQIHILEGTQDRGWTLVISAQRRPPLVTAGVFLSAYKGVMKALHCTLMCVISATLRRVEKKHEMKLLWFFQRHSTPSRFWWTAHV